MPQCCQVMGTKWDRQANAEKLSAKNESIKKIARNIQKIFQKSTDPAK